MKGCLAGGHGWRVGQGGMNSGGAMPMFSTNGYPIMMAIWSFYFDPNVYKNIFSFLERRENNG